MLRDVSISKLSAVFWIYLKECFAYPAASFMWVLIETSSALILPAVWIAAVGPSGMVAGMNQAQIVAYYVVTATLSQFIVCHIMWDIAWDIREGFFTSFMLRPMSFFWMSAARNLSWRITKIALFVPLLWVMLIGYRGTVFPGLNLGSTFWLSVALAHTLSFAIAYCLAMIPFWTTEFHNIIRLYYVPELFLSGRLLPLESMPVWLQNVTHWLPFPYTIAFPAELALGRLPAIQVQQGLIMQTFYIVFFVLLGNVLFERGIKHYTGVGM